MNLTIAVDAEREDELRSLDRELIDVEELRGLVRRQARPPLQRRPSMGRHGEHGGRHGDGDTRGWLVVVDIGDDACRPVCGRVVAE